MLIVAYLMFALRGTDARATVAAFDTVEGCIQVAEMLTHHDRAAGVPATYYCVARPGGSND
jgi:hypothetical protein